MWPLLLALSVGASAGPVGSSPKHVVVTVIDDLGFDDFGFANENQIKTPVFNAMHDLGIALSTYYVQPSCSPTRATILTGRKPVHTGINVWIPNAAYGLPLGEVTFADVLNSRGFVSHCVGKWHLGLHKTAYAPTFRGFSSYYGYYEGSEDYWTHNFYGAGLDFHEENTANCSIASGCSELVWDAVAPAKGQCDHFGRCSEPAYWKYYSTHLFTQRAVAIVDKHPAATALFLYLAFQGVHEPRQAPAHYVDMYTDTITNPGRRSFAGMLSAVDEGMGNVSSALKAAGMYDDVLFIVTTDNGGPTTECSTTGQSNWPLRGSKCSIWEGGTRGAGFLFWAGLPAKAQGLKWRGLIHAADWLPTAVFATTGRPVAPGETLPLDGVNMWPTLLAAGPSPRSNIYYGVNQRMDGPAVRDVDGFKLILASSGGGQGNWSLEQLPNASSVSTAGAQQWYAGGSAVEAGVAPPPAEMLLYNVALDAGEHIELDTTTPTNAAKVIALQSVVAAYAKTKVPQATGDPACPKFTGLNTTDPSGEPAKYIGPWCDGF